MDVFLNYKNTLIKTVVFIGLFLAFSPAHSNHNLSYNVLSCNNAYNITQCVRGSFNYAGIQFCFARYGSVQNQIAINFNYSFYGVNIQTRLFVNNIWTNYYAQLNTCGYGWGVPNGWCWENATRNFEVANSTICH